VFFFNFREFFVATLFLIPSLVSLIIGMLILRFYPGKRIGATAVLLIACFVILITAFYMACDFFSGNGINDAAIFHILYIIDLDVLVQFWPFLLLIPTIVAIIYFTFRYYHHRVAFPQKYFFPKNTLMFRSFMAMLGWATITISLLIHPAVSDTKRMVDQLYLNESARELSSYINVNVPAFEGEKKKSFMYIYTESLERTFFNEARFPGLMPNMKRLEQKALRVEGIRQAPMTGWTIAGMTASQCGIPLSTYKEGKNTLSVVDRILPGSICLGDILSGAGYHLSYMGGASLGFSYKGGFYQDHHFDEIYGEAELEAYSGRKLPKSKWGVYDDDLYDLAYKKWHEISENIDKPYGFFMLTLDTHSPLGHQTPACSNLKYADGSNEMLNAVHCADKLLAEFIEKVMSSPKGEGITIFVGSDHLMMQNRVGLIPEDPARTNNWMVFDKDYEASVIRREATTLDVSPTVLKILGFNADSYGLGRNMLNTAEPTLVEKFGDQSFFNQLVLWRAEFWKMWEENSVATK
jgi:phosphoglycerol transferase